MKSCEDCIDRRLCDGRKRWGPDIAEKCKVYEPEKVAIVENER